MARFLGCGFVAFAACGAGAGLAQGVDPATAALANSWALRADAARQEGAEARLRGALDGFMPSVAITADVPLSSRLSYFPQAAPTEIGLDSTPIAAPKTLGVSVDLPLFDGLRRWNTLGSARALASAGRFLTVSREQQLLLDSAIAYLAVARDARIYRARRDQIAAIARIRDATERQFATADATRTDVALARSRVAEAESSRDRASAEFAASKLELQRLTRTEPEQLLPPRVPTGLPRDEAGLVALVRAGNPNLAASRLDVQALSLQAEASASALLPQVNFQFAHVKTIGYSPVLDRITDTTARIVARVPIYEPGSLPRLNEAAALARQRDFESRDEELATLTSARSAFVRRKVIADQVAKLSTRLAGLRDTMKGYEIERGTGFRTVLDELNIRAELADAEVAVATVAAERDGLTLQLAAAASLLDGRPGPKGAKRFESFAAAGAAQRSAETGVGSKPFALRGSVDAAEVTPAQVAARPVRQVLRGAQEPSSAPR